MTSLSFPDNSKNPLDCADWLELAALLSEEHRCSIAAVERNLKRLSTYDDKRTIQQNANVESACAEVLGEIRRRAQAAMAAYPFRLEGTDLILSGKARDYAPYLFCLCLSWFGWNNRKGQRVFPRRMFEDLAKYAAEAFIGGRALRFGAPRTELPREFKKALLYLCTAIGEGKVREIDEAIHAQDDALDLIAWKDFPDRAEGKLFLVGQCASGDNWESKKRDLDAEGFFDEWFTDRPPSLRSMRIGLFIPHRVPASKWSYLTKRAGIIFDRCRIAYWSHSNPNLKDLSPYVDWFEATLAGVKSSAGTARRAS